MPKGVYKRKEGYKPTNSFIKGIIPWNKGKKLPNFHPIGMQGKKHTEEWFKKMKGRHLNPETEFKSGRKPEEGGNWQGGITFLNYQIRNCFKYRQWRSDVFQRDNYICQHCLIKGGVLNVHHIKSFAEILAENNIKTLEDALNCEELWNINNGNTLCRECHKKTDTYGNNNKRRKKVQEGACNAR